MNEAILEGAARVLAREGPAAFNTNRVASVSGVSVGSLYQYYPNKEALLFRLHEIEAQATWAVLDAILSDTSRTPRRRFELAVRAFFEAEAEEVPLRSALQRAEMYFSDTPEYRAIESQAVAGVRSFLREALPPGTRDLDFKARLVQTVVSSVAERVSSSGAGRKELGKWARVCSGMLCEQLGI
jgi:AcrR family transcriptional regulator